MLRAGAEDGTGEERVQLLGGSKMQVILGVMLSMSSVLTQICHRISRDGRRRSRGPIKTVRPSTVVIHRPFGADLMFTTGRQSPSSQHSCGYHETVEPSGSIGVRLCADDSARNMVVQAIETN